MHHGKWTQCIDCGTSMKSRTNPYWMGNKTRCKSCLRTWTKYVNPYLDFPWWSTSSILDMPIDLLPWNRYYPFESKEQFEAHKWSCQGGDSPDTRKLATAVGYDFKAILEVMNKEFPLTIVKKSLISLL